VDRQRISTGSELERTAGYSRAMRVGNMVFVSGTAAVDQGGNTIAPDDAETQTREILKKIERALHEAGSRLEDVVMTRMYVTDIAHAGAAGRVHGEFFGEIRPASLLVEISALARPGLVVEIEAQAVIEDR